jgi:hypothetical protein
MDDRIVAELSALRARAYGPGADLADDPSGLRRLGDLEELVRAQAAPFVAPAAVETFAAGGAVAEEAPSVTVEADPDAAATARGEKDARTEVSEAAPRLWWSRRRIAVLWVASLAVTVLVASTISAAFTYRLQADPREVAVLQVDAAAEWPKYMGDQTGQIFAEFYGLRVFSQRDPISQPGPVACLQVADKSILDADLQQGYGGPYYPGNCGAGAFEPTAALVVGAREPDELRERFIDGTSLQFVLRGSEVVVLSAPPAPAPAPSIDAAG